MRIDTAESRFGGASALFDDLQTTIISAADSGDWHFGAKEFTAEAWVRFASVSSYSAFFAQFDSANNQISWLLDWTTANELRFLYSPDGTLDNTVRIAASWTPAVNTWYHVAVDRDSSQNLRIYVDGNVLINTVVSTAFHDSTHMLRLGVWHNGWIDEVRITKGVAQYGGSFIPPDEPFVDETAMASAN